VKIGHTVKLNDYVARLSNSASRTESLKTDVFKLTFPQGMSGYRPNGGTATAQVVAREDDDVNVFRKKRRFRKTRLTDDVGHLADIVLLP